MDSQEAKESWWALISLERRMGAGDCHLDSASYPDPAKCDVVKLLYDEICRFTWDPGDDEDVRCQVALAEFVARCKHEPYDAEAELKRRAILPQIMARFPKAKPSYVYCGICGHTPKDDKKPNLGPVSWYDPDDGNCFGTLCPACAYQTLDRVPKSSDYCMQKDGLVPCSMQNTDEDITHLLT
jgi:hypothetical protein